ncbi:Uncharacterised protein [Mycobacterium tuberculosis]|nr:Uncharacterised protein [Mycobacterium tuberculosis]
MGPAAAPALLAVAADAWQISYRTGDSHDRAELTVTTLLVPRRRGPAPEAVPPSRSRVLPFLSDRFAGEPAAATC